MTVAQKTAPVKFYAVLDGMNGKAQWMGAQYRFDGDDGMTHFVGATYQGLVLCGRVDIADAQHTADTTPRQAFRETVALVANRAKVKLPESVGRIDKAVALLLAGDIEGQDADGAYRVGSQSDPLHVYRVQGKTCTCPDHEYKAPQGFCKHILAVMISIRVQELLPPALGGAEPVAAPAPEPVPATVAAVPVPATLPEAPASVNFRLTLGGREVQMTLRDTDETRLLTRLYDVLGKFPVSR